MLNHGLILGSRECSTADQSPQWGMDRQLKGKDSL